VGLFDRRPDPATEGDFPDPHLHLAHVRGDRTTIVVLMWLLLGASPPPSTYGISAQNRQITQLPNRPSGTSIFRSLAWS